MKALVKTTRAPGLSYMEVEKPKPGPDEVLIKIIKNAICGTDLHLYNWDAWSQSVSPMPLPMQIGHEYVGRIAELGSQVRDFKIGDRVSGEGHIICGKCRNCRGGREHLCPNTLGTGVNRPGAFAEYLCVPARNVIKIPDEIPDDVAAIFDPFGNAVHTALSFNLTGEDVLISGMGPIGLMCVIIARFVGARQIVVTDINPHRLSMAEKLGASLALNVKGLSSEETSQALKKAMKTLGMREGFDVGLEVAGNGGAINSMIDTLIPGGKLVALGVSSQTELPLPWNKIVFKGLSIKGIYGREMFETWYKMISLVQSGLDLSPIITHTLPASEFEQGFSLLKQGECGKVLLSWE